MKRHKRTNTKTDFSKLFPIDCPKDGKFYVYQFPRHKALFEEDKRFKKLRGFDTLGDAQRAIHKYCKYWTQYFGVVFWQDGKLKINKVKETTYDWQRYRASKKRYSFA